MTSDFDFNFKLLKLVEPKSKLLVEGYLKNKAHELFSENNDIDHMITSSMLYIVCCYYSIPLKFTNSDSTLITNNIYECEWTPYEISGINTKITKDICKIFQIEFTVKKLNQDHRNQIYFGFTMNGEKPNGSNAFSIRTDNNKFFLESPQNYDEVRLSSQLSKPFGIGDKCKMNINFILNQCSFYCNNLKLKTVQLNTDSVIPFIELFWTKTTIEISNWCFQ